MGPSENELLSGPDCEQDVWDAHWPSHDDYEPPCQRCHGTGLVTLKGAYYGGDADDQPCPECSDETV